MLYNIFTTSWICGYGLMVEFLLAKEKARVRFPLPAKFITFQRFFSILFLEYHSAFISTLFIYLYNNQFYHWEPILEIHKQSLLYHLNPHQFQWIYHLLRLLYRNRIRYTYCSRYTHNNYLVYIYTPFWKKYIYI